jgi:hypothetical protein
LFGEDVLAGFLERNHLSALVRGHQCVPAGVESLFGNRLYTVFSASNYCGTTGNKSGVLLVNSTMGILVKTYEPLPYLKSKLGSYGIEPGGSFRKVPGDEPPQGALVEEQNKPKVVPKFSSLPGGFFKAQIGLMREGEPGISLDGAVRVRRHYSVLTGDVK